MSTVPERMVTAGNGPLARPIGCMKCGGSGGLAAPQGAGRDHRNTRGRSFRPPWFSSWMTTYRWRNMAMRTIRKVSQPVERAVHSSPSRRMMQAGSSASSSRASFSDANPQFHHYARGWSADGRASGRRRDRDRELPEARGGGHRRGRPLGPEMGAPPIRLDGTPGSKAAPHV